MKNMPVIVDEREYWISRSVAVSCVVFAKNNDGELCVLINKRGTALFNPGKWNIPGGFIDYDENAEQCAKREVYEETGVDLSNNKLTFIDVNTEPLGKRQTIAIHYYTLLDKQVENIKLTNEFAEENEVDDIRFVPISKIKDYRNILTRDQEKYIMIAYDKLNSFSICKQNIC